MLHTLQVQKNMERSLYFAIKQSEQNFFDQNRNFHFHKEDADKTNEIFPFIAIQVYSQDKILYSSHNLPYNDKNYTVSKYSETKDKKFLTLSQLFINSSNQYIIRAFYFQNSEKEKLNDLIITLFFLILPCIVFTAIGSWYLVFKLLAPFRQVSKDASRISAKNLSERLKYSTENDEVGQLCITLNDLFSRLQRSFETLEKFTSDTSHELKTPLTIMQGDIEVLLRKKRSPEEYRKTLVDTINEIDRMHRLIERLLLLARAGNEKVRTKLSEVAFADLIELTKNNLARTHSEAAIYIEENIDYSVYIYGNSFSLQQIVENLLSNAFQNTPKKGRIFISLQKSKNYAKFVIKNTGEGIAPEHIPFIFDRFYRVNSIKFQGQNFGLGLAICKALAEKHKGYIEVKSVLQKETTFTLYLPLEMNKIRKT